MLRALIIRLFAYRAALLRLCSTALTLLLTGCAVLQSPAERADLQARAGQFQPVTAMAGTPMRAWLRQVAPVAATEATAALTVYIEGDGAEWQSKYQSPADPTPGNPLTLRLALRDPDAQVAYLGRPCQYLDRDALAQCPSILWLSARYGEHAVTMMSAALDILLLSARVPRLRLVGYSGGGAMAALLAARRTDVDCVVTVASPLDTDAWVAAIDVTPLADSLNPLTHAPRLTAIAQTHIAGADDTVVPASTLRRFAETLPHVRMEVIDQFDHDCCWVNAWVRLRARTCLATP